METKSNNLFCAECSVSLDDRPRIIIYPDDYCFTCAKQLIKDLEESCLFKYEKELKSYNEKLLLFKKKHPTFGIDMGWIGWGEIFIAILGNLFFPVIGLLVGFFIGHWIRKFFWDKNQAKLDAEFESKNPYPVETRIKPDELVKFDESRFTEPISQYNYRQQILVRDDYTCQNCGDQKAENDLEVHHVKTRANGGPDHPTNLILLCLYCHDRETWFDHRRMYPTTFRQGCKNRLVSKIHG